ncbi:MAG: hypothetical protein ACYC0C_12700 [Devosia sp.]
MQGQILRVEAGRRSGVILGNDGNRYSFSEPDWKVADPPATGLNVDFIAADGQAAEIFPLPGQAGGSPSAAPARPQPVAGAPTAAEGSSVLLGLIGTGCLVLGFIIPLLPTIAAFVLGLIGADSAKRHNNQTGLILSRVAWIGALVLIVIGVLLLAWAAAFAWPFLELMLNYLPHVADEQPAQSAVLTAL